MPNISLASGDMITLSFQATASSDNGTYCNPTWADPGGMNTRRGKSAVVMVAVEGDDYDEPIYSWPTAVVTVREAFDVQVIGPGGNPKFVSIQVIVSTDSGVIARWDIR